MQDESSALYYASQEGYEEIVELLIMAGAAVDLQSKVRITEAGPLSPNSRTVTMRWEVSKCSCAHATT